MAYRHSQDTDGKRTRQEEVEIIGCQTDRGVTTYIVRTQDGIECTAIRNIFTNAFYADDMIAVNGCGPTAIAMVAAGLTGDNTVTPYKVAQFSAENGYYAGDSGTSWTLMTDGAQQFGIYGEELGLSEDAVFSALGNGHPIICSMRPGDFTTTGHFIVLTGIEDGKIRVNDPNSRVRSEKLWDYSRLEYQINNLWMYTAM